MTRFAKLVLLIISIICSSCPLYSQDKIEMKKESSGVYTLPCEVNGLKLRFILDTGASVVSLSLTEASFMLKNGYLEDSDITGTTNIQTADGNIAENYTVNLKELKIGSVVLNDVQAVVSSGIDAPLLLGQSVLNKLGHWPVKNLHMGITLLDKLAQNHYPDALYDLCDYYLNKGSYDKVLSYAAMFDNKTVKNIYEGISYYNKKDYSMALNRFELIDADNLTRKDLKAEFLGRYGELYEKGLGCRPDFEKAYDCYQQLIEYDPAWGYGMLGDMFFLNELIETDAERAYKYYVLGANNDSGYCCFRLALMNYYGAGTYKNEIKAKEYKTKALKLGFKSEDFNF